jgi:hypothetical protein
MSAKPCDNCTMIMVNYANMWLVHSRVASQLDGVKLELGELKAHSSLLGACTSYPLLRFDLEASIVEIKYLKHKLEHPSHYSVLSPPCELCGSFKGKFFHAIKENPSSNYHQEEKTLKPTKTHYPSNPKPSFNLKREMRKETPKPREEAFVCIFCGCAGHLDEFCFHRKRIEKRHFEYARNSYRDEFFEFPPRSYSRALPRTSSHTLPQFSHGPNHRSYGFGSCENRFVPRRFGYGSRPHCGDHFPHKPGFSTRGSYTHFEPRHPDGPHFPRRSSRPTGSKIEVQKIVKTSSGLMVKCWIPKIYLTNPNTKPSTSSRHI